MSLLSRRPFSDLDKFFDDNDWMLPVFFRKESTIPSIDIYETDADVIAEVNIPDFDPEKVDVSVHNGILQIKGFINENAEDKKNGYWRREIRRGSFERRVRLPVAVKETVTEATYEKGLLKIIMPKNDSKTVSKVKIRIKENK